MSTDKRHAIAERLRRLLAITVDNGATEAEAMVAAEKAAALMAEHSMTYTTVDELLAEPMTSDARPWFKGAKGRRKSGPIPPSRWFLPEIEQLTGTRHTYNTWTGALLFFGPKHGTDVAHYLVVMLSRAIDTEWTNYSAKLRNADQRRRYRASFVKAMAIRLAIRLRAMAETHAPKPVVSGATTGTDLVVVANTILEKRFAEEFPKVSERSASAAMSSPLAALDGIAAGDRVQINQGLTAARGTKLLGAP